MRIIIIILTLLQIKKIMIIIIIKTILPLLLLSILEFVSPSWMCSVLNVDPCLAHLLRAYAIHVPVANLNVQSSMFNFFFSSPVESLCHTCTGGKPKCSEFHVQFFFYLTCWELMPYMYPWHPQFDNLNIENLMQTFENLFLQTCTFIKWKLILSNNEDNNNNIDISIAYSSCSWIAPPRYLWRPLH